MSIHLNAVGLDLDMQLSLTPTFIINKPYEDWLRCDINLIVPGFTGSLTIDLELLDFNRFLDQLRQMDLSVGKPMQATLTGVERQLLLELNSNHYGQIYGKYEIIHDWVPTETRLTGDFQMDQSYIQPFILDIQNHIKQIIT